MREEVRTGEAPSAIGPYSQAIRFAGNRLVMTAGQLGIDPSSGELVPGGIAAECRRALQNLEAVLVAGGSDMARVVKVTVFLADMAEFAAMNEVYAEFFPAPPPARSAFEVAALPKAGRVEIEALALAE
jgi:2-iminobutanoate/2-iminopropanoate deaminase